MPQEHARASLFGHILKGAIEGAPPQEQAGLGVVSPSQLVAAPDRTMSKRVQFDAASQAIDQAHPIPRLSGPRQDRLVEAAVVGATIVYEDDVDLFAREQPRERRARRAPADDEALCRSWPHGGSLRGERLDATPRAASSLSR